MTSGWGVSPISKAPVIKSGTVSITAFLILLAYGLCAFFSGHSPPLLTCLRNFIQVHVMGWVPATLPNSSTDSPARTFWSSGNWMIWGGMAGRGQVRKQVRRREPQTFWCHSTLLSTLVSCSSLTFWNLQGKSEGSDHCFTNSELIDLLGLFISLF